MELIFVLFTGFALGFSGAMIPGPLTLFTVSEVLKTNRLAGYKIISGHIIIELAFILVIFLGFQRFLTVKGFLLTVSVIGGLALMGMGVLLLLSSGKMKLSEIKSNHGFSKGLVLGGVFFSLASPGFFIWWATIGVSSIVRASLLGIAGVGILMVGHWLADVIWHAFLSYAVDKGKMYLSDRVYQNMMRLFAFLLIFLGVNFLIFTNGRV